MRFKVSHLLYTTSILIHKIQKKNIEPTNLKSDVRFRWRGICNVNPRHHKSLMGYDNHRSTFKISRTVVIVSH